MTYKNVLLLQCSTASVRSVQSASCITIFVHYIYVITAWCPVQVLPSWVMFSWSSSDHPHKRH